MPTIPADLNCLICGRADGSPDDLGRLLAPVSAATVSTSARKIAPRIAQGADLIAAASSTDVAILIVGLVDGITPTIERHALALHLAGVRNLLVLIDADPALAPADDEFDSRQLEAEDLLRHFEFATLAVIPVSIAAGDNILLRSELAPSYRGKSVADYLTSLPAAGHANAPMRFTVAAATGPGGGNGNLIAGAVNVGDRVAVLPAGRAATVTAYTPGEPANIQLDDQVTLAPGDVIASAGSRPEIADQIAAHLIWSGTAPLLPGRSYRLNCGTQSATATVSLLKHKINPSTLEETAARQLKNGDAGLVNISLSMPLAFDPHRAGRELGRFTLEDKTTGFVVGAGLIRFGLRRAENVHWQALTIDKSARATAKSQRPCCLWFTGLSGSGKSTVANLLERKLHASQQHTYILDGDNVRHGLNRDLGFADADRVENVRRVAEVAKLMVDAGLIVIVSFISPFRAERRMARELFQTGEFLEVYVDTPIEVCEARDPKGLYKKARQGLIRNFTGIDSAYEVPEAPELRLDSVHAEADVLVEYLITDMQRRGLLVE